MGWDQRSGSAHEKRCYGLSCVFSLGASNGWNVIWMGWRRWCLNTVEPGSNWYWERKLGLGNPKLFYITINSLFNLLVFQIWIILILILIVWLGVCCGHPSRRWLFRALIWANSLLHIMLCANLVWPMWSVSSACELREVEKMRIPGLPISPTFWGGVTKFKIGASQIPPKKGYLTVA